MPLVQWLGEPGHNQNWGCSVSSAPQPCLGRSCLGSFSISRSGKGMLGGLGNPQVVAGDSTATEASSIHTLLGCWCSGRRPAWP
jgi:hypothetical protein